MSGEPTPRPITRDMTLSEALAPDPEPEPTAPPATAVISGRRLIPTPVMAELIRGGAQVRPVRHPGDDVAPEPLPPIGPAAAIHPVPGLDLSVSGLRSTRRIRRYRPHGALPARADPPVQPQMPMQKARFDHDIPKPVR